MISLILPILLGALKDLEQETVKETLKKVWNKIRGKREVEPEEILGKIEEFEKTLKSEIVSVFQEVSGRNTEEILNEISDHFDDIFSQLISMIRDLPEILAELIINIITRELEELQKTQKVILNNINLINKRMELLILEGKERKEILEKISQQIGTLKTGIEEIRYGILETIRTLTNQKTISPKEIIDIANKINLRTYFDALSESVASRYDEPYDPTKYVNRGVEDEIIQEIKNIWAGASGIILIVAQMGYGKTWLVSKIREKLRETYNDIAVLLQPLRELERLERTVLPALGARDISELKMMREKISRILRGAVIILDGLDKLYWTRRGEEKVIEALEIAAILAEEGIPVMVTTRPYEWMRIRANPLYTQLEIDQLIARRIELQEFSKEELREALRRYKLPEKLVEAKGKLGILLRKPYFLRILAY